MEDILRKALGVDLKQMKKWHTKAKSLLRAKGITHQDVADRLSCTQGSASHKLNGRREASIEEIMIIADMLDISIAELVEDDPTFARNSEEKALIEQFRKMTDQERALAVKMLRSFIE